MPCPARCAAMSRKARHAPDDRQLASASAHIHDSPRYRIKLPKYSDLSAIDVREYPL
jgi:hypothetical protein